MIQFSYVASSVASLTVDLIVFLIGRLELILWRHAGGYYAKFRGEER